MQCLRNTMQNHFKKVNFVNLNLVLVKIDKIQAVLCGPPNYCMRSNIIVPGIIVNIA